MITENALKSTGLILSMLLCPILSKGQTYTGVQNITTAESYGVPAVINAGATVTITSSGSLTCTDLDFSGGNGTLTVESGGSLTVNGQLLSNGSATLTIEDGGSFVTTNTDFSAGSFVSNIVIEKSASTTGYSYMTIPITAENYTGYEYYFSESSSSNNYGAWVNSTNGSPKTAGIGYAIYQQGDVTFTGTPNNTTVSLSLSLTNQAGRGTDAGQHIIGNPFPAAIDMDQFFTGDNLDNTYASYYVYNADKAPSGGYDTYTAAGGDFMASGQAFFIQLDYSSLADGNHTIEFEPSIMVDDNNTTFYRKADYNFAEVVLNFTTGNDISNKLTFRFEEGLTAGFDKRFDAYSLGFEEEGSLRVKSLFNDKNFDILALPLENVNIPITMKTSAAGDVNVEVVDMKRIPEGYTVSLLNKSNGQVTTLENGTALSGSFEKLEYGIGFELRFHNSSSVLSSPVLTNGIKAHYAESQLRVKLDHEDEVLKSVSIYSLHGQLLKEWNHLPAESVFSETLTASAGLYLIKVESSKSTYSQKVIIK